jgi:hypothetical protein
LGVEAADLIPEMLDQSLVGLASIGREDGGFQFLLQAAAGVGAAVGR